MFEVVGIAAAAHGRQKGHFVAFGELRRRVGKLLIPRHYDAARQLAEARKARRVGGEDRAQIGSVGEFGVFPGHPHDVPQHPKKQYTRTHGRSVTLSLTDGSGRAIRLRRVTMHLSLWLPLPKRRLRVRYAETDQMGVVYYANYLVWMEVGRVELCKACGFNYRDMETEDGIFLAVAEAHCQYRYPARFDDEVIVRTWIEKANTADGDVRATKCGWLKTIAGWRPGETRHVFVSRAMRPTHLPQKYHALFGLE